MRNLIESMSIRRRYIFILVGFSLILTLPGGLLSWKITQGALERELDEKLVWVAGVAEAVGLDTEFLPLIRGPADSTALAYTSTRAQLDALLEYVDEAHLFRADGSIIVSTRGHDVLPIGSPFHEMEAYRPEVDQAWSDGQATSVLFQGSDGRAYKYGFKRLGDSGSMLAVLMQADFLQPLVRLRTSLLGGAVLSALLAGLLGGLLATNIVNPVERLARVALRIQRGRWDQPVETDRSDELGRLARAMERMRVGIVNRDEQLRLMLAQVAHEIRNPLGGLELFASAALESEDPEERRRLLTRVRREVEELNGIINEFLTFARPLNAETRIHDIRGPLREATELAETQLRDQGGELEVVLPEAPLLARADPDHVKRVALNLLQNAGQAGKRVRLGAWWRNGEVVVSVSDDGPGVPRELRDRIFDPFVTDKQQGAGLGLAIVKRVLESNGARVALLDPEAEPDPDDPDPPIGEGAEFRVYFPGADDFPADPDEVDGG